MESLLQGKGMKPLLLVLLCLLLVMKGEAAQDQDRIKQDQVVDAFKEPEVESQIQTPPKRDAGEEDEEATVENDPEPFIYEVQRPTMPPPEAEECEKTKGGKCKKKDLEPYKKWKTYNEWSKKKTPLFIIIFGGLRWDYLTPSPSNMTGMTVGKMKAFNWVKENGVTISQINPVFPPLRPARVDLHGHGPLPQEQRGQRGLHVQPEDQGDV